MYNTTMHKGHIIYLLIFSVSGFLLSCAYNKGDEFNPNTICTSPISNVSFSLDIQPILTTNCATANCHSGTSPEGNLNLEATNAYNALHKVGSGYIDLQDPRSSVLYSSLISRTSPMPPLGRLSACDLKRIEIWMQEGALDN
jgi:hypothetical protein